MTPENLPRALAELGLAHLADVVYTKTSMGERQLALIARALSQEAEVLVLDEPAASLDFGNQVPVIERLSSLARGGNAVIFSTHDPDHALLCADRVALLHQGRLLALGPPSEVVSTGNLRALG